MNTKELKLALVALLHEEKPVEEAIKAIAALHGNKPGDVKFCKIWGICKRAVCKYNTTVHTLASIIEETTAAICAA